MTNTWPHQLLITKLKQFGGSTSFVRRSQWTVEQLRQVNGINPNKVSSILTRSCLFLRDLAKAQQWLHSGQTSPSLGHQNLHTDENSCSDSLFVNVVLEAVKHFWSIFGDTDVMLGLYFECTYCKLFCIKACNVMETKLLVTCSPFLCSSRIAQSLTWCLTTQWTIGWPAHQQRSVSLSRSCTMPARSIGRGKQGVWERQGSWAKWAARRKKVSMPTTKSDLVPVTPQLALHPELCRSDGRAIFLSDRPSSSTVSQNSQEVL